MTVVTNRFYAPKGRHIVIKKSCLNAFRVMERHAPLPLPSDLENRVMSINHRNPKFGL